MVNQSWAARSLGAFSVNSVQVEPSALRLSSRAGECAVEPKVMALLIALANRPGELWLRADLIDEIWPNGHGSDETLTRVVSVLRKALSTAHRIDNVITTVPKLGYRLDATIQRKERKTRVAVLPFRTLTDADDPEYFADGIVDELITRLGQLPTYLVTARTSAFHFKNSDLPLPEVAQTLGVDHLIEGAVQHQNGNVRIDVRLIDGTTGFESWSYRCDGALDDIFASRDDVSQAVIDGFGNALGLKEAKPKKNRMTSRKAAYQLYLQGCALTRRAIGDGVLTIAIDLLEQALELDPDFAECWTALAEAHCYTTVYTPCMDRLNESRIMAECAQKAIALDPTQGHAHAMLGIHKWTQSDALGALDFAFKAYELEPDNADVALRLGSFLMYCGLTKRAMPLIEAAIAQDPVHGRNYAMLSTAHLNLGNIDAAIAAGQRMVDLGFPSMWLGVATAASGDHALAIEQYQQTRLLLNTVIFPPAGSEPMSTEDMDAYWLMAAKGICGDNEADRQTHREVTEMLHGFLHDPVDTTITLPAIWLGQAELVFKTIGKQITPSNMFNLMSIWADIEPMRQIWNHPDFMAFAERIGMVAVWEKYGWPDLLSKPEDESPHVSARPVSNIRETSLIDK